MGGFQATNRSPRITRPNRLCDSENTRLAKSFTPPLTPPRQRGGGFIEPELGQSIPKYADNFFQHNTPLQPPLAQFQSSEANERQDHRDNPETHDYGAFLPALLFEMVMQRRHSEHALSRQLE